MPPLSAEPSEAWVDVPFRVQKEHGGMRLDSYLVLRLHYHSRARAQKLIDGGSVTLSGRVAKHASRLIAEETVLIRYPRTVEPPVPHATMPILYQDEAVVVINKPGGTLSHPTDRVIDNTVTSILSRQIGRKVYLAHRLDRETSGALVLSLDAASARALQKQFLGRSVRKEYLAVVFGDVAWEQKLLDAPIGPEGGSIRMRQAVGKGQTAVTEFQRLAGDGRYTLISAKPRTGRLHQIRAHLAHLGHPVVGDKLYVGEGAAYMKAVRKTIGQADLDELGADRQLLHAWRLSFELPPGGKRLEIEAPVPLDFPLRPDPTS